MRNFDRNFKYKNDKKIKIKTNDNYKKVLA